MQSQHQFQPIFKDISTKAMATPLKKLKGSKKSDIEVENNVKVQKQFNNSRFVPMNDRIKS